MPFPGTVWAPNTWKGTAWASDTWADAQAGLVGVILRPDPAACYTSTGHIQLVGMGQYSDGSEAEIAGTYTATGGSVNAATGYYTAGATPGTYSGGFTSTVGGFTDTTVITLVDAPVPGAGDWEAVGRGSLRGRKRTLIVS